MLTRAFVYLRGLLRRRQIDADVADELRFHLDQEIDANLARGLPLPEARRVAMRDLGGVTQTREAVRDVRTIWLDAFWRDATYALRRLRREPGFATTAILTLAVGIGANTSVVTIVHGVLSRTPSGLADADRLVWIKATRPQHETYWLDKRKIDDVIAWGKLFANATGYNDLTIDLAAGGTAMRAAAIEATPQYFQTLGTRLLRGRPFNPAEATPEAIISEPLWRERFGGTDQAIGAHVIVNGRLDFTIVGIAPRGFAGASLADSFDDKRDPSVWLSSTADEALNGPGHTFSTEDVVARLQPGVSIDDATRVLSAAGARWALDDPRFAGFAVRAMPVHGAFAGAMVPAGTRMMIFVFPAVVLLIACANLAALILARNVARAHEVALRRALGASTWQIVRQRLVEHLLLVLVGGAAGLVVSIWATTWLIAGLHVPRVAVTPDATILLVTFAICLVAVLLFGVAPALIDSRPRRLPNISTGSGAHRPPRRARLQRALVVVQIALSLTLLASGGVLLQAVRGLMATNVGFDVSDAVLNVSFDLDAHGYPVERRLAFWNDVVAQVSALPGVQAAALADVPPFIGRMYYGSVKDPSRARAGGIRVSPDYFKTLTLPLVRGRDFAASDSSGATAVAIVTEDLARSRWPNQETIGQVFPLNESGATGRQTPTMVFVVGVARDLPMPERSVFGLLRPQFYLPLQQHQGEAGNGWAQASLLVRTSGDAMNVLPSIRSVVHSLDPNVSLFDVATVRGLAERMTEPQHVASVAITVLGIVALLMAAIGTFGVMAYAMAQRTREVGIRMALGAQPADVIRMGLGDGGPLTAIGLAIGLPLGIAASRVVRSMIVPGQPMAVIAVLATLLLVTAAMLFACYLPARRASRIDPAVVLKTE